MSRARIVHAVIQARMGSSRLPGKVLRPLGGRPVLAWVIRAARAAAGVSDVIVATSENEEDERISDICSSWGVPCVRGPDADVLSRYTLALDAYPADVVVRLTADCPLLDPDLIAHAIGAFAAAPNIEYLSTVVTRSLPRGLDVEVVAADALRDVADSATGHDRTHVTSAIYTNPDRYRVSGLVFSPPAHDLRVTLDTPEDAAALDALVKVLGDRPPPWREVVSLLRARPDLVAINGMVRQKAINEG